MIQRWLEIAIYRECFINKRQILFGSMINYKIGGDIITINKKNLIKSPLNYVGSKYKLLPQILPLFPDNIDTFVDLFAGGCNVGININANKIICNDTETVVINLMNELSKLNSSEALHILKQTISKYALSKTNEEGFKRIREDYNAGNKTWDMFYSMLTNAFNYQIRFNRQGEYNMPFGRNRSWFNPTLEQHFIKFVDRLEEIHIEFTNKDFRDYNTYQFNKDDFVYCDPPYLVTTAAYNENGGWTEKDELDLLSFLDDLYSKNIKFALSNVLESKGKSNDILKEWSGKYNVHYLDKNYSNSNYQRKETDKKDIEVLITNY